VTPQYTTIITPLDPAKVETCRQYLREKVEPFPSFAAGSLKCQPLFPFDQIETLHFCSFVILDGDGVFAPSLIFEATFDGLRVDFLRQLLRVAPQGMHEIYRDCEGYPSSGLAVPEMIVEYFIRHDAGAHTFFCGYPGRSAVQIKDEDDIHSGIASFLPVRWLAGKSVPARLNGFYDSIRSDFILGRVENRWAGEPAQLPWEMRFRNLVAEVAIVLLAIAACAFGAIFSRLFLKHDPFWFYDRTASAVQTIGRCAAPFVERIAVAWPWLGNFIRAVQPALPTLIGVTILWAVVRGLELYFSAMSQDPRDQFLTSRLPLHLFKILRYALMVFLLDSFALAAVSGIENPIPAGSGSWSIALITFVAAVAILAVLRFVANGLKLMVELKPLSPMRESLRLAKLDGVRYATILVFILATIIVIRQTSFGLSATTAHNIHIAVYTCFVVAAYAFIGVFVAYVIGLLLFFLVRSLELSDREKYSDPAGLMERSRINAAKYEREESGINTFQNHLTSLTYVKPGPLRGTIVRLTLFTINLLSRFWFNRGDLGGISTILSARWVMIDGGRRLLFLDNYGGAWESYLNEFIDMAAVKGLNAIWTGTFVPVFEKRFSFPGTRFFFWQGAQDEQPFKAYVRQSQVETIAWYSAYPVLSVVNVNTNTELRQSLSSKLTPAGIDNVFQRL
jgi:hypothetical protein